MKRYFLLSLLTAVAINTSVQANDAITVAAENAKVFFVEPLDGAVVPSTFAVKFGAAGVDIVAAGVVQENSGHHHLLIDLAELPPLNMPLPATEQVVHFGKAQTEAEVTLSPGKHTLQLLLGNFAHIPHKTPVVSEKITITVE